MKCKNISTTSLNTPTIKISLNLLCCLFSTAVAAGLSNSNGSFLACVTKSVHLFLHQFCLFKRALYWKAAGQIKRLICHNKWLWVTTELEEIKSKETFCRPRLFRKQCLCCVVTEESGVALSHQTGWSFQPCQPLNPGAFCKEELSSH